MCELLTGRKAVFSQPGGRPTNLAKFIRDKIPASTTLVEDNSLLDPKLSSTWPSENYKSFAQICRECVDTDPSKRPVMKDVAKKLKSLVDGKQRLCVVCMENPPNARLQCGHAALCQFCGEYLLRRGEGCPMCRAPVVSVQLGSFSRTFIPTNF